MSRLFQAVAQGWHQLSVGLSVRSLHTDTALYRGAFYTQIRAQDLWKTNTTVSTQGRQRGRAKGLMRIKNLHRGQRLGFGPARLSWPGLTRPAINRDRNQGQVETIASEVFKSYQERILDARILMAGRRGQGMKKKSPLERGWTGFGSQGSIFGPPEATNPLLKFDDFKSVLLEHKITIGMDGKFGRIRRLSQLMLTGNGKGVAGFSLTKGPTGRGYKSFQQAINRAGLRLLHFDLYEGRTVYHDFFTQFGHTRIFIKQKPLGFGVKAHRVIKSACGVIGISDLEAVVEGSMNTNHMVKAFFLGLLRQRTHQTLANEKQLHLVELRAENDNFPRLVASPSDGEVRTKNEIMPNEVLDFKVICHDGYLPDLPEEDNRPHFMKCAKENRDIYIKRSQFLWHHFESRISMLADHGAVRSHLTERYPECVPAAYVKKRTLPDDE